MNKFIFKLYSICKQFIHNVNYLLYINQLYICTLGPACYEVGYNKHPAMTSTFSQKRSLLIDINVKKDQLVL